MPKRREDIHEERQRKALADLKTLDQQADGFGRSGLDHNTAEGDNDQIERWGKLIGRGLGILFVIYLLYYIAQILL